MKKIHLKKPDIKGALYKIRHLKKEDIKAWYRARKERRERILEARRNGPFCPENEAGLRFYEPLFTGVSCPAGMSDQFCHRGHLQAFTL